MASYPDLKTGNGGAEVVAAAISTSRYLSLGLMLKAAAGNSDIVYVGASNVSVLGGYELAAGEEVYLYTNDPGDVYTVCTPSQNEQQTITYVSGAAGETFQLSFEDEITSELAYDDTGATIETAFEALSTVGVGNGTITGGAGGPWTLEWTGTKAGATQEAVVASNIGIDEVQTATYIGDAATDTYYLTWGGNDTVELAIDDNNAAILAALEGLDGIESGDVVLSGGAAPGTPVVITFAENLANTDVGAITGTGGTNEVQTITITDDIAGDSFAVSHGGQTSADIAYDATAATVQTELEAMTSIAVGDVVVTGADGGPYTLTWGGAVANSDVAEVTGVAGTDEVQTVTLPADAPTGGTWSMDWDSEGPTAVAWNASAATIQTALEGYGTPVPGDILVTGAAGGPYTFTYAANLANSVQPDITADGDLLSGRPTVLETTQEAVAGVDEVQTVSIPAAATGGTFTLTFDAVETGNIAYNADGAAVDAALEAIVPIGAGDVAVTGPAGGPWVVTFETLLAAAPQPDMTGDGALLSSFNVTVVETQVGGGGVNEIQTIGIPASITSGTFTMTYNGQTTGTIAWNASAGTVEAALKTLTNIDSGDVTVTGGPGASAIWICEFKGNLAGTELVLMGGDGTLLAGGHAVTVVETTPGVTAVNEQQTLTIPADTNGGTYLLTLGADPGTNLAWDANAAAIKTDLETNIAAIDTVAVSGTNPYVIEFQGGQAGTDVALMICDTTLTTGGDPIVAVTATGHAATFTPATTVAGNALTVSVAETQKGASKSITIAEAQSASKESKYSWIGT